MKRWEQMTGEERAADAARRVAESRAAQGLPPKVNDRQTLAGLAGLVRVGEQHKKSA